MNRRLGLCIGLASLLAGSVAFAQEEVTIGYSGLPYKSVGESNTGIQLSDSSLLHVGLGVEAGYDTNVFYANTDAKGSGIIRVLPYAELTNATRNGPTSKFLSYDLRAGLQYRYYTSSDADIQRYSNSWNPTAGASLSLGGSQVGFGIADVYARIEDAPYAGQASSPSNSSVITRNNNQASAEVRWAPGGGRLTGTLRYVNVIDLFDQPYTYANSVSNTLMADVSWRWLPKTAVFLNVSQGYTFYTNDTTFVDAATMMRQTAKVSSYPLRAVVGLRGLLTEKTSALLSLGYANGFYSSGGSTNGFLGSTYAELSVTVRPNQLSRIVVGGRHDFLNSVISNFAYEETAYASYVQQIAGRLALDLSARYQYLNYQGNIFDQRQVGRTDNFFQVGASLDYFLRNWAYVGVGYSLLDNNSNIDFVSYVKQQVFARIGVTY
jgi:hypothetical protein